MVGEDWNKINSDKQKRIALNGACNNAMDYLLSLMKADKDKTMVDKSNFLTAVERFYNWRMEAFDNQFPQDKAKAETVKEEPIKEEVVEEPQRGQGNKGVTLEL